MCGEAIYIHIIFNAWFQKVTDRDIIQSSLIRMIYSVRACVCVCVSACLRVCLRAFVSEGAWGWAWNHAHLASEGWWLAEKVSSFRSCLQQQRSSLCWNLVVSVCLALVGDLCWPFWPGGMTNWVKLDVSCFIIHASMHGDYGVVGRFPTAENIQGSESRRSH